MTMRTTGPLFAIAIGLILLGVISYVVSEASSMTALIPALFGMVLLSCALVARNPGARIAAIAVAAVFSLLGCAASLWRALPGLDFGAISVAKASQLLMAILLLAALVSCVIELRRK
ncbi:MAG: hypothetical protein DHS20C11_23610 [Lysobacteraceae bacterium]|nr:MAG: hypothetical protein DHS20C11_23610 [Xanthomonadaceae bacterium]